MECELDLSGVPARAKINGSFNLQVISALKGYDPFYMMIEDWTQEKQVRQKNRDILSSVRDLGVKRLEIWYDEFHKVLI